MIPSPSELTYFYEIALAGNVSKAAHKLQVSQPSLSMAINRLEKTVGTAIFIRHKQGVTLTQAGKKLFQQVKPLLLHWENTKSESLAAYNEIQGEVTLGCHTTVALFLHKLLHLLLPKYPKLNFHLKHDISQNTCLNVINSIIDVGIVVNPIKHPDLIIKKFHKVETLFWKSIAHYPAQDIDSDQLIIICDPNVPQAQNLLKKFKKKQLNISRVITSNSLEIVASLTVNGCGVGILPSCFTQTIYPNQLIPIVNAPIYTDNLYLIYRKENRNVKAVTVVIEALKQLMESIPKTNDFSIINSIYLNHN